VLEAHIKETSAVVAGHFKDLLGKGGRK
jgi:hypothetical protein